MPNGIARIPRFKEPEPEPPVWTLLRALEDENLFKPFLKNPETWKAWFAFLAALFALPMDEKQLELYKQCTGRTQPPSQPHNEAWLVCGRRGGKSFTLALIAVFASTFRDYRPFLTAGEKATVLIIATDRKQSRVIFRYIRSLLLETPMLSRMVIRETADSFELDNSVVIEIHTANFRSVRGYTIAVALLDEIAFWYSDADSASPDTEILAALRPAMATIPGCAGVPCCWLHRAPTPGAVRSGTIGAGTTERTTIQS
jgi:hypothetical protein